MTTLTSDRFAALAEAYGGTLARWPAEVRDAAEAMAREPAMAAVLEQAAALDARLDLWTVAAPAPALRAQAVSSYRAPLARRVRLWWAGVGIATALAGTVAGSVAAATLPLDRAAAEEATAFGSLPPGER